MKSAPFLRMFFVVSRILILLMSFFVPQLSVRLPSVPNFHTTFPTFCTLLSFSSFTDNVKCVSRKLSLWLHKTNPSFFGASDAPCVQFQSPSVSIAFSLYFRTCKGIDVRWETCKVVEFEVKRSRLDLHLALSELRRRRAVPERRRNKMRFIFIIIIIRGSHRHASFSHEPFWIIKVKTYI